MDSLNATKIAPESVTERGVFFQDRRSLVIEPTKINLVNDLFHFCYLRLQKLWHNTCRNVIYDII